MTKLVLRRDARRDLSQIDAFSRNRFGPGVAQAYMTDLRRAIHRLRDFPLSGAIYPGVDPPIHSVRCGSHRIFYDYFSPDDLIAVVRILHMAMNAEDWISR